MLFGTTSIVRSKDRNRYPNLTAALAKCIKGDDVHLRISSQEADEFDRTAVRMRIDVPEHVWITMIQCWIEAWRLRQIKDRRARKLELQLRACRDREIWRLTAAERALARWPLHAKGTPVQYLSLNGGAL